MENPVLNKEPNKSLLGPVTGKIIINIPLRVLFSVYINHLVGFGGD